MKRQVDIHQDWVENEYWEKMRSLGSIAKELGTYPNKIRRILLKGERGLRDKSEAQKTALKSGRHKHPTAGTKRSAKTKRAISAGVAESWDNIDDAERERRAEISREQWNKKSPEEVRIIREKAIAAVRRAAIHGSKLEKFLQERLTKENWVLEYHKKGLIPNHNLEIDLYLPEITTIVEVDGPSHFLPVWGNEALQRTIKSDNEKNGLILGHGFCVVRVKQLNKNVSINDMWLLWETIEAKINAIKTHYPKTKEERYCEIDVTNLRKEIIK